MDIYWFSSCLVFKKPYLVSLHVCTLHIKLRQFLYKVKVLLLVLCLIWAKMKLAIPSVPVGSLNLRCTDPGPIRYWSWGKALHNLCIFDKSILDENINARDLKRRAMQRQAMHFGFRSRIMRLQRDKFCLRKRSRLLVWGLTA